MKSVNILLYSVSPHFGIWINIFMHEPKMIFSNSILNEVKLIPVLLKTKKFKKLVIVLHYFALIRCDWSVYFFFACFCEMRHEFIHSCFQFWFTVSYCCWITRQTTIFQNSIQKLTKPLYKLSQLMYLVWTSYKWNLR